MELKLRDATEKGGGEAELRNGAATAPGRSRLGFERLNSLATAFLDISITKTASHEGLRLLIGDHLGRPMSPPAPRLATLPDSD